VADRIRQVDWAESATSALDEVVTYIHKTSPQNARLVLTDALAAAASLMQFAERGRLVPERINPETRELLVRGFRLMYKVTETRVTVVAFIRSRRAYPPVRTDGDAS